MIWFVKSILIGTAGGVFAGVVMGLGLLLALKFFLFFASLIGI